MFSEESPGAENVTKVPGVAKVLDAHVLVHCGGVYCSRFVPERLLSALLNIHDKVNKIEV